MRFIICMEERRDGTRTTELASAIFATDDEFMARREFDRLFAVEVNRLWCLFPDVTEQCAPDMLIATAEGGRRTLRMGLLDELVSYAWGRNPHFWLEEQRSQTPTG